MLLKDRALKLLVTQLQRAQNLPVTPSKLAVQGLGTEMPTPTVLTPQYGQNTVKVLGETSPEGSDKREKSAEKS